MTKEDLQEFREWADLQIASAELPSTWYQLMKLREALDAILYGLVERIGEYAVPNVRARY